MKVLKQFPVAEQHTGSGCVFKMWVKLSAQPGRNLLSLVVGFEHLKLRVRCLCELTRVSEWCSWARQLSPEPAVHHTSARLTVGSTAWRGSVNPRHAGRQKLATHVCYPPGTQENRFVRVCLFYSSNYERLIGNVYCWDTNWECLLFTCLFGWVFFPITAAFLLLPCNFYE